MTSSLWKREAWLNLINILQWYPRISQPWSLSIPFKSAIIFSRPKRNPWSGPEYTTGSSKPLWVEWAKSIIRTSTSGSVVGNRGEGTVASNEGDDFTLMSSYVAVLLLRRWCDPTDDLFGSSEVAKTSSSDWSSNTDRVSALELRLLSRPSKKSFLAQSVSWSWTRDIWLSFSKLFACTLSKSKFVPEKNQNVSAGILWDQVLWNVVLCNLASSTQCFNGI